MDDIKSLSDESESKTASIMSSAPIVEARPAKSSQRIELKGAERRKRRSPKILLVFSAVVLVCLIFAGGYFLGARKSLFFNLLGQREATKQVSTEKNKTTPKKEKDETTKVDKAAVQIDVLNGNGLKGESAAIATVLRQSGWAILNVTNADNYDYAQTVLRYKAGFDNAAKVVAKEISQFYPSVAEQALKADSKADIVIVLGKDKKVTKSSVGIRILNGNGKKGSAQEIAEILKKNGFQVKETKNADKFDYPESVISYKPGQKDAAQSIAKQIANKYSANLKEDASLDLDVVILLGLK